MRAIGQGGSVDTASVSEASRAVAGLRQSLQEMQQGQVRWAGLRLPDSAIKGMLRPCVLLRLEPTTSLPAALMCRLLPFSLRLPCCSPPTLPTSLAPLQAALELQLKYSSGGSQLAALAPQVEEQQRALSRWEARLGRQLEAIVGLQKGALSARSSGSLGSAVSAARGKGGMQALSSGSLGENTPGGPMQTPAGGGLPFRPAGGL